MKSQDLINRLIEVFEIIFLVTIIHFCSVTTKNSRPDESHEEPEAEFTDFAGSAKYLFDLLKNPATGRIPEGTHERELAQAKDNLKRQQSLKVTSANTYLFQGPQNLAGRTRVVVYDIRYNGSTNKTIMSGGVNAGIFKSTDNGINWSRKSPTDAVYSVTSIAQDTRLGYQDVWYYSTGEGAVAPIFSGEGIFKSVNNGESWTKLPASNPGISDWYDSPQDFIWKVIVNPVNGDVYMGALAGIYKSTDGGATWNLVLSGSFWHSGNFTDIVVTPTGRLYAAFAGNNSADVDGVWTSSIGDPGNWSRIAGEGPGGSPSGWNAENNYGRIALAIVPGNENIVYAALLVFNSICPGVKGELFRWNYSTGTWTDLSNNLPGCSGGVDALNFQSGYDMVIAVKPNDPNIIFIGGTNLYRSTDGFTTTNNVTQIGGYNNRELHPDMHSIAFEPGNSNIMLCGNDGGIQKTPDNLAGFVTWLPWSYGCRTYQYYYVDLDPRTGSNKVLGGAQDNGTTRNINESGTAFELIYGGDGVSVGLSNNINGTMYEYCGYQSGNIARRNKLNSPNYIDEFIRPVSANSPNLFVTLFKLDPDNTEFLYYASDSSLYRTNSASTVNPYYWTQLTGVGHAVTYQQYISALATTRGNYNPLYSSLFIGDWNGKVYRLDDPVNVDPSASPVNITSNISDGGNGGYVSSISVNPRNDDTVLVTYSTYGALNIWWTGNANATNPTWVNVERNLTWPSARSSAIAITAAGVEYFVGTSVGLYKTTNPLTQNWTLEGASDIGFAVVSGLALRPSDNRLLVGTYGYGMWATTLSTPGCSTNTWIGIANDAWENPLNWSCGLLPNANTHVIINYGNPFNPKINSNVTIKELTIDSPGLLIVSSGYKLELLYP